MGKIVFTFLLLMPLSPQSNGQGEGPSDSAKGVDLPIERQDINSKRSKPRGSTFPVFQGIRLPIRCQHWIDSGGLAPLNDLEPQSAEKLYDKDKDFEFEAQIKRNTEGKEFVEMTIRRGNHKVFERMLPQSDSKKILTFEYEGKPIKLESEWRPVGPSAKNNASPELQSMFVFLGR